MVAVIILAASGVAHAGVIITASEIGGNLVFSGSGTIDLASTLGTVFNSIVDPTGTNSDTNSADPYVGVFAEPLGNYDTYELDNAVGSGSSGFGVGLADPAAHGGAFVNGYLNWLFTTPGYVSNSNLDISYVMSGYTFADLGHVDGDFSRVDWSNGRVSEFIQINWSNSSAQVVPEPTSMALAGFAGIGMAVGAWRRRRQQPA